MDKEAASAIISHLISIETHIGEMDTIIFAMPDCDEKKAFIHGLGDLLQTINFAFVFKIIKKYPDLDPDKGKEIPSPRSKK